MLFLCCNQILRERLISVNKKIMQEPKNCVSLNSDVVIADKGYDANHFVEAIEAKGAQSVIPPRSNRLNPREYDRDLYKEGLEIECHP